jgi:hypothetical protein
VYRVFMVTYASRMPRSGSIAVDCHCYAEYLPARVKIYRATVLRIMHFLPQSDRRRLRSAVVSWVRRHLQRLAHFLALLLQKLISGLESAIELLGCEPDRRWENALILHAVKTGKGNIDSICKRAKSLADKGHTEDALSLYIKVRLRLFTSCPFLRHENCYLPCSL